MLTIFGILLHRCTLFKIRDALTMASFYFS
jgi:hypothetical protein